MSMKVNSRFDLPTPMRQALIIMLREGYIVRVGRGGTTPIEKSYRSPSGVAIWARTIVGLCERYLAKRARGRSGPHAREIIKLTEAGALAAQALAQIEMEAPLAPDNYDDTRQVYFGGESVRCPAWPTTDHEIDKDPVP